MSRSVIDSTGSNKALNIALSGDYAFLAGGDLEIIDISDPYNPVEVSSINVGSSVDVAIGSNYYAYINDQLAGMRIVDISNPASPYQVSLCVLPMGYGRIVVRGDYVYMTRGNFLYIIDVSDPASPHEVASLNNWSRAMALALKGDYLFITISSVGIFVVDVSDPTSPEGVEIFNTKGFPRDIVFRGNCAYIADGSGGLCILTFDRGKIFTNTPSQPAVMQNVPNPFNSYTTIPYYLPEECEVEISLYDIRGRLVKRLVNGERKERGYHMAGWDSTDDENRSVNSSIYIAEIKMGTYRKVIKMILIK